MLSISIIYARKKCPNSPIYAAIHAPRYHDEFWRGVASPYVLRDFTHSLVGDFSGHLPHISNSRERGADSEGIKANSRSGCEQCWRYVATAAPIRPLRLDISNRRGGGGGGGAQLGSRMVVVNW